MKNIRIGKMERLIKEKKIVTLKELQDEFNISINTVRRDIEELIRNNNFKKIYGGIKFDIENSNFTDFDERNTKFFDIKERIGKKASEFVEDNDIIFIDSGTTALKMVKYLTDRKNLTVITNNLLIIMETVRMENIKVIAVGGDVNRRTFSFSGKKSLLFLEDININKAFMAATGFTFRNGATNSTYEEKDVKSEVINRSKEVFLLIDHTKFDNQALFTFCNTQDIGYIITDKAPEKYRKIPKEYQLKLIECVN